MKDIALKIITIVLVFTMLLTACVPAGEKMEDKKQESEVSVYEDKQDEESQELMDEILKASELLTEPVEIRKSEDFHPHELTGIVNGFSSKTSSILLKDSKKNSVYSPISLYIALSMLREMADGETKLKLDEFLEVRDINLAKAIKNLIENEHAKDGLVVTNSYWVDGVFKNDLNPEYLKILNDKFYAYVFVTDFDDDEAYGDIDNWALKTTKGMIKLNSKESLKDIDLKSVLLNAVYYESTWIEKFEESDNYIDVFYGISKENPETEFMTQTTEDGYFYEGDKYKSAQLLMKNGSIHFILPSEGISPQELLSDENFLTDYLNVVLKSGELTINLPKFEIESSYDELLRDLNLTETLGQGADLSRAFTTNMDSFISKIAQKAKIIVNEEGAKAAAVTEIADKSEENPSEEKMTLNLNRPFIFLITLNTQEIVFVGSVVDL